MKTVWLVTRGEYSDYSVVGIFSSKENALKYSKHIPDVHGPVEVEVDGLLPELNTTRYWIIDMERDGTVIEAYSRPVDYKYITCDFDVYLGSGSRPKYNWIGKADSREHAIKICNEKRIQHIAMEPIIGDGNKS